MFRAIGPSRNRSQKASPTGPRATRPGLGRMPVTEQKLAGVRRLPPRSDPCASQTMPVASATAAPPEDPPQVRSVFHGFRVRPNTGLKVCAPAPNSGVLDFASTMPPAASRARAGAPLSVGTRSAKIGEP